MSGPIAPTDDTSVSAVRRGIGWWVAALILILMPPIAGVCLLASRQMTYMDVFPFWSDEIYYWHQAVTFTRTGFEGGYYTVGLGEKIAPAEFSHFNFWGVVLPVFYGSIGKLVGWYWWSIPVINIVMMSLALLLWIILVQPSRRQMAVAGVLLFTFSPFLTYIPVSMSEILQMSLGIALAAGFYVLCQQRSQSLGWTIAVMLLGLIATGLRPAWGVLLPIIGLIGLKKRGKGSAFLGFVLGLILGAAMYRFFIWTSAPYPGNLEMLAAFSTDPGRAVAMLLDHARNNVQLLMYGSDLEKMLRLQVVSVWGIILLLALRQHGRNQNITTNYNLWDVVLYTFIFMGIVVLVIPLYKVGDTHDYRFIAPFVLLGGFLLVGRQQWVPVIVMIGMSLMVLFSAVYAFGQRAHDYRAQQAEIVPAMRNWEHIIKQEIIYDASALSPWCNTLTFTTEFLLPPYLPVLMEPGIGLSLMFDIPDVPLKARYLLLDDSFVVRHESEILAELIMPVPNGAFYRNLDTDC